MASSYHLSYSHCVVALHLIDGMCPPVDGDCIALFKGAVELITKELKSLLLGDALVKLELGAHVLEVGLRLQLRHPRREHHGQQADQQAAVVSQDKIGCGMGSGGFKVLWLAPVSQSSLNFWNWSSPPLWITWTNTVGRSMGLRSRNTLIHAKCFRLKLPITWPKSMWKSFPFGLSMMLSLWRSPMPRTNMATV